MTTPPNANLRRRFVMAMCLLPLAPSVFAATAKAAEPNPLDVINRAGRQRMLSQRMAKLYAQILHGVRDVDARNLLADSIMLFESQLADLRTLARRYNDPGLIASYDQLSTRWLDYKQVVGAPATPEGLKNIAALNELVLASANEGTQGFERFFGGSLGKLVNMAGRQRMLSQRLAKFYFFMVDGIENADVRKGYDGARKEFITSLQTLKNAPENTHEISSWIALAETQWMFFDDALHGSDKAHEQGYLQSNVAVSSENILQVMDKLTGLYAALS
jgi:hypothetical protein